MFHGDGVPADVPTRCPSEAQRRRRRRLLTFSGINLSTAQHGQGTFSASKLMHSSSVCADLRPTRFQDLLEALRVLLPRGAPGDRDAHWAQVNKLRPQGLFANSTVLLVRFCVLAVPRDVLRRHGPTTSRRQLRARIT